MQLKFLSARGSASLPTVVTTYDILKSLAVVLMIVDHVGYYFYPDEDWIRAVGRLCVPIWLFLIGYARSRRIDALLVGGAILLTVANWAAGLPFLAVNILFTIILVRLVLDPVLRFIGTNDMKLMLVTTVLCIFAPITNSFWEYGTLGLLFGICGHLARNGFGKIDIVPKFYAVICLATLVIVQDGVFHFTPIQNVFVAAGSSVMTVLLFAYLPRNTNIGFAINSRLIQDFLRFTGRHTLEIYIAHLLIFKLVRVLICGCTQCVCRPHFSPLSLISS